MMNTMFACLLALSSLPALAVIYDTRDELSGVALESGKEESTRHYRATYSKTFDRPLVDVGRGITNFGDKCNNRYKGKRTLTDKDSDCKFHVEDLVESKVTKLSGENDRYLVARQIYNRGHFAHYELVQISEGKNDKGQKTVTISQRMLEDKEV
jgi:hypothetical protein